MHPQTEAATRSYYGPDGPEHADGPEHEGRTDPAGHEEFPEGYRDDEARDEARDEVESGTVGEGRSDRSNPWQAAPAATGGTTYQHGEPVDGTLGEPVHRPVDGLAGGPETEGHAGSVTDDATERLDGQHHLDASDADRHPDDVPPAGDTALDDGHAALDGEHAAAGDAALGGEHAAAGTGSGADTALDDEPAGGDTALDDEHAAAHEAMEAERADAREAEVHTAETQAAEAPAADTAGVALAGDTAGDGTAAGDTPTALKPGDAPAAAVVELWGEEQIGDLRGRWREVQLLFVDDPKQATGQAGDLIAELFETLSRTLDEQRAALDDWRSEDGDTERLRVAMRRYRDFFDRLLGF